MLTRRQKDLFDFISGRVAEGLVPSYQEMADALGLRSKSGVHRLVLALEERGFIRRLPERARALEVIAPGDAERPEAEACARVAAIAACGGQDAVAYARAITAIYALAERNGVSPQAIAQASIGAA